MRLLQSVLCACSVFLAAMNLAHAQADGDTEYAYKLLPGDQLKISVWRDDQLNEELSVLPDGSITFPLAGRMQVKGLLTTEVEELLKVRLAEYLNDPVVTVSLLAAQGNRVYMMGKVLSPGPVVLDGPMTLAQVLSMAGGFDKFADLDNIRVLRNQNGQATFITFDYDQLVSGNDADRASLLLEPGDVIIVP